jgi:hypothetical protein
VDVIPTGDDVIVGEAEAKVPPQRGEVGGSVKISSFVLLVCLIEPESSAQLGGITGSTFSPDAERSLEVEFDHHAAEVEQQGAD